MRGFLQENKNNEVGYLLPLTVIVFVVLIGIGMSIAAVVSSKYAASRQVAYSTNALYAAEAGVSDTIAHLRSDGSFAGFTSPKDFVVSGDGRSTYVTSVTPAGGGVTIESIGYIYRASTDTVPSSVKKIRAIAARQKVPISGISAMAGAGGLHLGAFAKATAAGGNGSGLYVLGKVTMDGGSGVSIGSTAQPVDLTVANIACGTATDWPQPCASTSNSITTTGSFTASIYGSVCTNGVITPNTIINAVPGLGFTGLKPSCVPAQASLPMFDKKALIDKIRAINPASRPASDFTCSGGMLVIPADTWIVGNITVGSSPGGCQLLVGGDIYVDGDISIGAWNGMGVAESAGSRNLVLALSGKLTIDDAAVYGPAGSKGFKSNSAGAIASIISFYSSNLACSKSMTTPTIGASTCLTNGEAMASAKVPSGWADTRYAGLTCGGAGNTSDMSGATFYAYYGIVDCSSPARFQAIGGQGIKLGHANVMTILDTSGAMFGNVYWWQEYRVLDYQQVY